MRRRDNSSLPLKMTMRALLALLPSNCRTRNHHRRYEIVVGRDLPKDWTVTIRYGGIGQGGQEKTFATPREDEARGMIRERLLRRLSANTRISFHYRLTVLNSATGFDTDGWLPHDVIAQFSTATN
jgi:predicted DNA-binding WGR domain protein